MKGVPNPFVSLIKVNGRWESGLIDVGGDVRIVLPLPCFPHRMSASYRSAAGLKHLSPSRRRALRPFFVQGQVVVQTMPPPRPAAGFVERLVIAQSERYC